MKKNNKTAYILAGVFLYVITTGVSFLGFSTMSRGENLPQPPIDEQGHFVIDPSLPRTEECPMNGQLFTEQERAIWETRRPLAVMIENHVEARPQSGLSYADIVYEAVAEGGITRFMGIFHCGSAAYDLGLAPVRSARTYFVDWVSEYDALYNHVGGAGKCNDDTVDERAKALCQIQEYGIKDMDQFNLDLKVKDTAGKDAYLCVRNYDRLDHEVAHEHTMVCYTRGLYAVAEKRGWTNVDEEGVSWDKNFVPWKFADEAGAGDRGAGGAISFTHWEDYKDDFEVKWQYDAATNSYLRNMAGQSHVDLETGKQLAAKNVAIQFSKETRGVDEHGHLLFETIGTGKAIVFQNGKTIAGTWKKPTRVARTTFYDDKGAEIEFVRGQIWIEVVPTGVEIVH